MKTINHIAINTIFGSISCFLIDKYLIMENLLIIILAGALIDIDHVFVELFKGTLICISFL